MSSFLLYKERKQGVLSTFPFGAYAFARLDERLKDEPLWQDAMKEAGRDPMGLTMKQPNIEFFTTEVSSQTVAKGVMLSNIEKLYGGPKPYEDFPIGEYTG